MPSPLDPSRYRGLLKSFLNEDIGSGDLTSESVVPAARRARGELLAKAPLVLAGIDLFAEVFRLLDPGTEMEILRHDGEELSPGESPARLRACARALLSGERVALNLLQRLSGVATLTRSFVRAVAGTGAKILDTRKTTPGLRAFEKYAVLVGGGQNHRKDLSDAVLIKENHIRLGGGVAAALRAAQSARGRARWIEVEVTNLDELREALAHGPDVVLLDNFTPTETRRAVEQVRASDPAGKIRLESSGGITLGNVRQFAEAGVDWISVGALTHSAPAVDLSLEIEPADE
jgi:nicotinate-nucleotide pyrophosphorylase (carboxylating)